MARRGRSTTANRTAAPDGVDGAVGGVSDGASDGSDNPGARTMGAIALRRWMSREPDGPSGDDGGDAGGTHGPYDEEDLDPEHAAGDRVDFGAIRIPVPRGGEVTVEPEEGRLQAVHVMLPAGRLSVSALAAPRTARLWPDLAAEIDESLREGGATVRSYTGEWGRELHARTGEASSVFVGVDGPRWMLYGVATGPTDAAPELDAALRWMLHDTVVVRGRLPYPVRTVLPLTVPEQLRAVDVAPAAPMDPAPVDEPPSFVRPEPAPGPPPAARRDVLGPPVPRPAPPPRPLPAPPARDPDDRPTEPYGLPRIAAAGSERVGSPSGAGRPAPARSADPDPAWTDGPAPAPPDPRASPARPLVANGVDRGVSTTGQHTVADLLARAERERTAAAEARTPPVDPPGRRRNGRPYGSSVGEPSDRRRNGRANGSSVGEPSDRPRNGRANGSVPGEPRNGYPYGSAVGEPSDERPRNGRLYGSSVGEPPDHRSRNGSAYGPAPEDPSADAGPGVPTSRDALPTARDLGPPPRPEVRFPDVGRPVGVPVDGPPAAPRADPAWSAYLPAESRPSAPREHAPAPAVDGSDDWTVPMAVVPSGVDPDVPDGGSDLWAGDPWAAETRRIARAARAAVAASDPVPSPGPEEPGRRQPPSRRSGHRATEPEPEPAGPARGRAAHGERATDRRSRYRPAHQRPAHQRPAHGRPGADDVDGPEAYLPPADFPPAGSPPPRTPPVRPTSGSYPDAWNAPLDESGPDRFRYDDRPHHDRPHHDRPHHDRPRRDDPWPGRPPLEPGSSGRHRRPER